MNDIKIFVIHNEEEVLNKVVSNKFIKKINLNNLELNEKYKTNKLAENRFLIYLSNNKGILADYDYIGICSASWDYKYETDKEDSTVLRLEKVPELVKYFKKNFIYVPAPIKENWYERSIYSHAGMEIYIDELLERNKFKKTGSSFYSNNFICKRSILINFLDWWRKEFDYFFEKYECEYEYDSENCQNYKENVNCAYFYERITLAYFANKNYNIVGLDPRRKITDDKACEYNLIRAETIKNFNKNSKLF
jgi:hypothetical protein